MEDRKGHVVVIRLPGALGQGGILLSSSWEIHRWC
jgi:hypothetical protein